MIAPTWDIAYTTDDASDTTPTWTTVSNSNIRSVSVSRGRENELGRVEAGTCTLVLNNRTNLFNPVVTTGLRPMNRWRIRAVYSAVTYDVFLGYAESYEQQWPATGKDAITIVQLVDEFKVLALDRLPTTDPPRNSYGDLIAADEPTFYYSFNTTVSEFDVGYPGEIGGITLFYCGGSFGSGGGMGFMTHGAVAGDQSPRYRAILLSATSFMAPSDFLTANGPGDAAGLSEFTGEFWFKRAGALEGGDISLFIGPQFGGTGNRQWRFDYTSAGKIKLSAYNSANTLHTVTSTTVPALGDPLDGDDWYHVVGTITGGNLRLYINGTQEASTAFSGTFGTMDASQKFFVGSGGSTADRLFDEVAFYRYGLSAARVLAHYNAGALRGFPLDDLPGPRITAVLAASTSVAASSIQTGTREMVGRYMTGQPPLDELRNAEAADSVDSVLFIAKDGTITFLADGHRSSAPWNTVQATFDDDGTDLPYRDCAVDYSETFLYNTVNVTRTGGSATSTSSDSTSVSRYHTRSLSFTDLPIRDDADQSAIAAAQLAKYKDPFTRVTSVTVDLKTAALIAAVLDLEIADRVRILRTNVGGGTRIDQTSFIQSIQLTATPDRPWQVRLGVSPL